MANRYWVGGTGDWSDTSNWSTTSGGSGGASVPTQSDDVFFDANSFSSSGQTVTISSVADCQGMDWTGVTNSPTFAVESDLYVNDDFTLDSSISQVRGRTGRSAASNIFFWGGSGSYSADFANLTLENINLHFDPHTSGSWTLNSNVTGSQAPKIYLWGGTLNTNGYSVSQFIFYTNSDSFSRTLTLGSSNFEVFGFYAGSSPSNLTINAGTSTIELSSNGQGFEFEGGNKTYNNIAVNGAQCIIRGNNTFNDFDITASGGAGFKEVYFEIGSTQTVTGDFTANGSSGDLVKIRSHDSSGASGEEHYLSKSSGRVSVDYLDLENSIATGGASWFAGANSVDTGFNSGWQFTTPEFQRSISGGLVLGGGLTPKSTFNRSISGGVLFDGLVKALRQIDKISGKTYLYFVKQADGTFIGTWEDVQSDPEFEVAVNEFGTHMNVTLGRSAARLIETREVLHTEASEVMTTESGDNLYANLQTSSVVGSNTDVDVNYDVDVYVYYGSFDTLVTESGEDIIDEADSETLLVAIGAPSGKKIFSGWIAEYSSNYDVGETSVDVLLISHGSELDNQLILDGSNTTKTYSSQELATTVKDILDTNAGTITYNTASIDTTSVSEPFTFRLNTKKEGLEAIAKRMPSDYYMRVDVAENILHLKQKALTADHTFVLGKHLSSISLRRSIVNLKNTVYFVGGDTGGGTLLYKKYEDATSVSDYRVGLERFFDSRVTNASSAQTISESGIIERKKDPKYAAELTIPSEVYEIEDIKEGDTVGFANFDNFIDDQVLQIVKLKYTPYAVTLSLDLLLPEFRQRIDEIERDAQEQYSTNIPNAPS